MKVRFHELKFSFLAPYVEVNATTRRKIHAHTSILNTAFSAVESMKNVKKKLRSNQIKSYVDSPKKSVRCLKTTIKPNDKKSSSRRINSPIAMRIESRP